ncbi:MAG: T9SS type A sorting domain-containing protein [Candidatus Cyclonatronum sp.]|uniref:T9SS type A sorting domain-containing protein n=1 Tax=Cyclonatronum sp. TaxID=3024185 RepID=UPI0025BF784B|nr:T9SS type A sorting domain-containing protein [Cyclonatronum sp.]MCH8487621.1 T9SS type A sorting domain-containing protein [Cyclonatronum sp.]
MLAFVFVAGWGEVMGQVTVAEDNAGNYTAGSDLPAEGSNEGFGFEGWNFNINPSGGFAGRYIGGTAIGDPAFGLFSGNNVNAEVTATRSFAETLRPGDTFSVVIGHTPTINGEVGLSLLNGTTAVWTLKFVGGDSRWTLNDGGSDFTPSESQGYEANTSLTLEFTFEGNNQYSYSFGSDNGFTGTFSNQTVTNIDGVRFFSKNQGSDQNFGINNLQIESAFQPTPTTNASNLTFSNIQSMQMDLSWTSGNGSNRIVVAREGAPVSFTPENGTDYTANNNFSLGSEVGPVGEGNKVVYKGNGDTFTLTGLDQITTYHFAIFEYNGSGTETAYLTTAALTGSQITANPSIVSATSGDWNTGATWVGGVVPDDVLVDVTIANGHTVTVDVDASINSITIESGATLQFTTGERTLTISDGGFLSNSGTFIPGDGSIAFAGAGSVTGTLAFNNLNISGAVNPGTGSTVNGTLSVLSGGSMITNTPAYGSSSTLRYNTGATVNPGTEWPTGNTANPINVTLQDNDTVVSFGSDTAIRTIGGNLLIGAGSTLRLSTQIGGDLRILGNWTNEGSFDANGRTVIFAGSDDQIVTNEQEGGIQIDFLINNSLGEEGGLRINSDLTVQVLTNNTLMTLDSIKLTVKNGGQINNAFTAFFVNGETVITFEGDGTYNDQNSSEFNIPNLEIGGGVAIVAPNISPTITGRFVINQGGYLAQTAGGGGIESEDDIPDFAEGATLVYTGLFEVNSLASGWGTSGAKVPDNVAVEGSGSLTISVPRSVSGLVSVASGATLNANGNLTLESGGFLLNEGTVNGAIDFQRIISEPTDFDNAWVSLSAPASNALFSEGDVSNPTNAERALLRKVWTQGFPGANDTNGAPSVILYDETTGAYAAPASNAIEAGRGFFAFLFQNKDRDDSESAVVWSTPFSTQGNINNTFPFDFPVSYTTGTAEDFRGWNLLGNPFPAALRWNTSDWNLTGDMNNFAYLYDPENAAYVEFDRTAGTPSSISPFQAFWVRGTSSNFELSAEASARTASGSISDLFRGTPEMMPELSLELNAAGRSSSTRFRFAENYVSEFSNSDAYFLSPLSTTFAFTYSLKSETPTAVNSLPLDLTEAITFPIAAGAYVQGNAFTGEATFTWPAFENIPADWTITLTDTHTGTVVDLRDAVSYSFIMEAPAGLMSKVETFRDFQHEGTPVMHPMFTGERFILTIDPEMPTSAPIGSELPRVVSLSQNYPNPFNPTTLIRFELPASEEVRLEVYNVQGQRVAVLVNGTVQAGVHNVSFDASTLSSGVYLYRLQAGNQVLTRKMTLIK